MITATTAVVVVTCFDLGAIPSLGCAIVPQSSHDATGDGGFLMSTVEQTADTPAWYAAGIRSSPCALSVDADQGLDADEVQRRLARVRAERAGDRAAAEPVGGRPGSAVEPDEHHAADRRGRQLRDRAGRDRDLRARCW